MTFLVVATLATLCVLLLGLPAVLFALMVETARERDGAALRAEPATLRASRLRLVSQAQVAA